MKTHPSLGPKGLILYAGVNPVCGMPLFSEARLLLVITVHDTSHTTFVVHCTPDPAPVSVPWSRMLGFYAWYHAHSTVRYCTEFPSWLAKFTLKSSTAQCSVQCALKVVVTHEEYWEAMAEWVMFDAVFSDVSGIPSANIFRFQHLMYFLGATAIDAFFQSPQTEILTSDTIFKQCF